MVKTINEDGSYDVYLYNSDNNLIKILYKDKDGNDLTYYRDYQYTGTDMTTYTFFDDGTATERIDLVYNDGKLVKSTLYIDQGSGLNEFWIVYYTYSGDKISNLVFKADIGSGYEVMFKQNFIWNGSNVSRVEELADSSGVLVPDGYTAYTYDDNRNPFNNIGLNDIYGDPNDMSANNIIEEKAYKTNGDLIESLSYDNSYEYNTNDYPTKFTQVSKDGLSTEVITAEYEVK